MGGSVRGGGGGGGVGRAKFFFRLGCLVTSLKRMFGAVREAKQFFWRAADVELAKEGLCLLGWGGATQQAARAAGPSETHSGAEPQGGVHQDGGPPGVLS
jgi:hypothetical protein